MELRAPTEPAVYLVPNFRVHLILQDGHWLCFATETRVGLINSTAYNDQAHKIRERSSQMQNVVS